MNKCINKACELYSESYMCNCRGVLFLFEGCNEFIPELAKESESTSAYRKQGEFQTVGELKKLLEPFQDEMPIGFINQPKQDLYLSIDLEHGSQLGFQ